MNTLDEYNDIMTVEDLMEFLYIGRTTAYKLLKDGAIRSLRIGKIYRIPKVAVAEYMKNGK